MIRYLLVLSTLIVGVTHAEIKKELLVSAGVALKNVFTELGGNFDKKNNVKTSFNFAASGQLMAQVENGAPVDLFAVPSITDMESLEKKNFIEPKTKVIFARTSLVLVQNNNAKYMIKTVEDLTKQEIKKIAMGNTETMPGGKYAKQALEYYNIYESLKEKIIFGENIRQVLDYVSRNEVDAGFVFLTDALTDKKVHKVLDLPEKSHKPIIFPIAVIKSSKNIEMAKKFIEFVSSKEGKQVLKKYGFN